VCIDFEYTNVISWSVVERRLLDAVLEIFVYEPLELLASMLYSAFSVYPRAPASDAVSPDGAAVKHCMTSLTVTSACSRQPHTI
jgi:hypothetical protein